MLTGKYLDLYKQLKNFIPENHLYHDELKILTYGTDASFYRLLPKLVIKVESESEVVRILKRCHKMHIPVTFRAAGTSLSGQAITDSVLILLGSNWQGYTINNDASEITLQPGITGAKANQALAAYQKKIGPDPASVNSAKIGGIIANNASGMSNGNRGARGPAESLCRRVLEAVATLACAWLFSVYWPHCQQ